MITVEHVAEAVTRLRGLHTHLNEHPAENDGDRLRQMCETLDIDPSAFILISDYMGTVFTETLRDTGDWVHAVKHSSSIAIWTTLLAVDEASL